MAAATPLGATARAATPSAATAMNRITGWRPTSPAVQKLTAAVASHSKTTGAAVALIATQKARIRQLELENESLHAQLYPDAPTPRADRLLTGWELD